MNSIKNELVNNQSTFVLVAKIVILMSLCNDKGLLFKWMHLLFPVNQDRINLMIRYAQHSHLFICSQ